jgi:hypothetical protein
VTRQPTDDFLVQSDEELKFEYFGFQRDLDSQSGTTRRRDGQYDRQMQRGLW